jgi:hypothetical protein
MQPPKSQKDNDLQNTTQKDRPTRTPPKQGEKLNVMGLGIKMVNI